MSGTGHVQQNADRNKLSSSFNTQVLYKVIGLPFEKPYPIEYYIQNTLD